MISDDEWVLKLKEGSEEAFQVLFETHSPSLLRHLIQILGNHQEAEEILHESMMLMIDKINFYTPKSELKNSFKAWLFRLSTNRAIDEIRKRKKTTHEIPEIVVENKVDDFNLNYLLGKLPSFYRTLLNLRVQDDLSYEEISVILGKDINSVKQGLFLARKKLKELMVLEGEFL